MADGEALRRVTRWGGRVIVVLALGFLVWSARQHWASLSAWKPTPQLAGLLVAAAVVYGLAMMLIGESWHHIVSGVSKSRPSRLVTWPSFGVTQVAKYLPGNVLHYVGRHVWLNRQGVTHREAITALVWEWALLSATALGCATIVLSVAPIGVATLQPPEVAQVARILLAALLVGLAAVMVVRRFVPRLRELIPAERSLLLSPLALLGFFSLQGATFWLLFGAVGDAAPAGAVAIASLSWLVGYVTPGAPGGIGSREAVMVTLAAPLVGSADALILAGLFRVVTTGGDLVCFGLSSLCARWAPAAPTVTGSAS